MSEKKDSRTVLQSADPFVDKVIPRRTFLKGAVGFAAVITAGGMLPSVVQGASGQEAAPSQAAPKYAYVGCYTSKERKGNGQGIKVYRIDPATGDWTQIQLLEIFNPSFLTLDRQQRFLYSVHGDGTFITAFAIDQQTGLLTQLNQQPTGGKNSVHSTVDPTNKFLVVANYSSGAVAAFPINEDGSLGAYSDLVPLPGDVGPNRFEQTLSHPHHIPFDLAGRFIVVPDKGLDKVFVFRLDTANGKLIPNNPPWVKTRVGAGPRHVGFHPSKPYVYVINELDSSMTTYGYDPERGELKPIQVLPALPTNFTGDSVCAEIAVAPSGKFVYGSNRGHDSVTIFAVDQANGTLSTVGWEPTQGITPRFITLHPSGDFLYAANQDSDKIVAFKVNKSTGKLTPSGQIINTGSPVCIIFR
ncbi:MAG: lactonase family protein [Negativicutes bacterium]|nr:lactonase family protein [Negativicutes bacterium]